MKFSLNDTTYQNNSLVTLGNIGENSLLCMTNFSACCRRNHTNGYGSAIGNWFFPNWTRVPSHGTTWDFYRSRGDMVVLLHRKGGGVDGIYSCVIPVSMNVNQSIYIGVYNASTGEWQCLYTLVLFNSKFTAVLMLPEGLHLINHSTTDDKCTCHATLAACNQLVQSVLKIGFALAKKLR